MPLAFGDDEGRTVVLLERAEQVKESDPDAAAELANRALEAAVRSEDAEQELEAMTVLGRIALRRDRHPEALTWLRRARALAESTGVTRRNGLILRGLGDALYRLGTYDDALERYTDAVEWYQQERGDDARMRIAHLDVAIGNVLWKIEDVDRALEYYRRGRDEYEALGFDAGVAGATINIGNAQQELGQRDEALESFRTAAAAAETLDDDVLRTISWNNMGSVLLEMGRREEALERFQASLKLSRATDRARGELHALQKIGTAHLQSNAAPEAVSVLRRALGIAEKLEDAALQRDIHADLAEALEAVGDPAAAVDHLRRSMALGRELLDEARLREIERLEAVRMSGRRERELEVLRRENRADRLMRVGLTVVLGLAVLFIVLLFVGVRQRSRSAAKIHEANARLQEAYRRVDELSRTDPLTGLPNRRDVIPKLEHEIERASRGGRPFALALLDLDGLKNLNDLHGHLVGDEVLRNVAGIVRSVIRAQDMVGRWGGDELILILPETDLEGAAKLCETLRYRIASDDLGGGEAGGSITATVGLTECHGAGGVDDCVREADAALYRGKSAGRNAVST